MERAGNLQPPDGIYHVEGKIMNDELFIVLQKEMPAIFAATEIDRLTGNAVRWVTIQNRRANKRLAETEKPPKSCFMLDGCRKILIKRDEFLSWWLKTLQPSD